MLVFFLLLQVINANLPEIADWQENNGATITSMDFDITGGVIYGNIAFCSDGSFFLTTTGSKSIAKYSLPSYTREWELDFPVNGDGDGVDMTSDCQTALIGVGGGNLYKLDLSTVSCTATSCDGVFTHLLSGVTSGMIVNIAPDDSYAIIVHASGYLIKLPNTQWDSLTSNSALDKPVGGSLNDNIDGCGAQAGWAYPYALNHGAFSPDGQYFYTLGYAGTKLIRKVDTSTWCVTTIGTTIKGGVLGMSVSADGGILFVAHYNTIITAYNLADVGSGVTVVSSKHFGSVRVSPDGTYLLATRFESNDAGGWNIAKIEPGNGPYTGVGVSGSAASGINGALAVCLHTTLPCMMVS